MYNARMDHSNGVTKLYVESCKEAAAELDIPCVDIFDAFGGVTPSRQEYLCDGLHFNAKGEDQLLQCIKETLTKHLPHWDAATIHSQYPDVMQLDFKNPPVNFR